jgi:putative aldouronate transport system permease protein
METGHHTGKVRLHSIDRLFDRINIALLFVVCAVIVYPLYYVLVASFTEPRVVTSGTLLLWPTAFFAGGYQKIMQYPPIWVGYLNTIRYTFVGTAVAVCTTVPCAYALSRKDLFGQKTLTIAFTFTMFFQGGLIPLFLVIVGLNIYNTIWAVTLPTAVSVWNLIICRSFFQSNIPEELLAAASIDGCNDLGFFFKIVLPLSSTIITVMILFYSTALWNAFMNPLMFLSDAGKMPLQVVLRNLVLANQASYMTADAAEMEMRQKLAEQLKFGIIVISALPLLTAYPFLQRYFTKGVMVGAIKG